LASTVDMRIESIPVADLRSWPGNARTHSKAHIRQIKQSIGAFGFTAPVLIGFDNTIVAGHGRVAAAKLLDMKEVPCIRQAHLTEDQCRAYVLADNKLALNSGWDELLLAQELKIIINTPGIDVGITGFSVSEVDLLIEGIATTDAGDPRDDAIPALKRKSPRSMTGDVWLLGPHRLVCGNSLDPAVVATLMGSERARMVFTDPPYNVPIEGHVSGLGKIGHREFAMASGEMSAVEFTAFLQTAFENQVRHSLDGSIHFVCMDWRHMTEIRAAGEAVFSELKNLIVWAKDNGGMGSFYRSRHELIFPFKYGTAAHINAFELGQHGRYRTNVWEYRGANSAGPNRAAAWPCIPRSSPWR
jgi:ParB-like nuclease domain/DNA methylase